MYDIVFISYKEPYAETNFKDLYDRFNQVGVFGDRIKRIKNITGIHNAHFSAANLVSTSYFFAVDGDAVIQDDFDFNFITDKKDHVFVYKSINPINDLIYGYGGVKLLPTKLTKNMNLDSTDMTTSISQNFEVIDKIANITMFNTDPFNTWKSAFRECAKLASKTIRRQEDEETEQRLKTWTTVGHDRPFGEYALAGATAGMEFGLSGGSDLRLINDFEWLKSQFDQPTKT
jgi:hypothetical protein